ncbi:rifin [Plasmodium falciparum IGH-CR14]|uniref:Rifin n=1 Tax=Plasmodium falciparum IGH-CR14 TaxID=580059 RepID=A0A0L1I4S3_PLAFA|nr:rifin [Plasmodium falciparum IGH-CR14]KNG74649.1 rifin [Plasmodium falciparum IGH-CR14]
MKFSYFNILLFSIPLNILINDHSKYSSCKHTSNSKTTKPHRSLYECELYSPANNDNDPEMKRVMQQFEDRTSQRFHEYDERMQSKRMQCKEQCDKEIQKIILKDKLEKQMEQQLTTLETKIDTDDIPTCVCEKSLADKVEKGCLRCGYGLGTVAPTVGLIGAVAVHVWKPLALKAAIAAAIAKSAAEISAAANAAGIQAGKIAVIESLKKLNVDFFWPEMSNYILEMSHYNEAANLIAVIYPKKVQVCREANENIFETMCQRFDMSFGILKEDGVTNGLLPKDAVPRVLKGIVGQAEGPAKVAADAARQTVTAEITEKETAAINTIFMSKQTAIIASVVAIVVIVLIMLIIYLILRHRRKKKMKKKLQYIKLLEE